MKIGILGFAGSGKTTFLSALALSLLHGHTDSDLVLYDLPGADTTRDLTLLAERLQNGQWPPRTEVSKVQEYVLQLRDQRSNAVFSLHLPELPGELLDDLWATDTIPAPLTFLRDYQAYLLFVDALGDDGPRTPAHYVHLLQGLQRAKGYAPQDVSLDPLGLVLTKWDALPDHERSATPDALLQDTMPLLVDFVDANTAAHQAFAISSVGATDALGNPLPREGRIRPHRLFDPIAWVASQLHG